MKALLHWCGFADRGVAAVEFAITLPVLLAFLGAVTDFGIVYYSQSCLATAVAAGAQYANLTDQRSEATTSPGPALTAANIQTVMTAAAAQSLPFGTVTSSAACYCITGSATTSWNTNTPVNCASTTSCANGASKYAQLSLTYTYTAMLPLYSMLSNSTPLTQTMWIPLQ